MRTHTLATIVFAAFVAVNVSATALEATATSTTTLEATTENYKNTQAYRNWQAKIARMKRAQE